jgi:chloramphenicol O-acetyltransferase type B
VIHFLKRIRNRIKYQVRYPRLSISSTAAISTDVLLLEKVSIGSFTSVETSTLGQGTIIHSHCILNRVVTENNVALYSNGCFEDLNIGCHSYIASYAKISVARICRFCSIGPYLICGYGDHPTDWLSTSPVFFSTLKQCGATFSETDFFEERKPILIGHDVWIGARVFIRDGIKIGNGAIVAAGAVVTKDVPEYAVVGGVPAKVIRYRFSREIIESLLSISWWDWPKEKLCAAQPYFVQNDINSFVCWAKNQD